MGRIRDMLAEGLLGKVGIVKTTPGYSMNFDGAAGRRRLKSWQPTQTGINTIMTMQGPALRARCRDVMRNNGHAVAGSECFVSNLIGTGIKPSPLLTDTAKKKEVQELWLDWTDEADAGGLTDFYGLQGIVGNAIFEAGEVFCRMRARRPEDGLTVPLQLELLESEMCPYHLNQKAPNGNTIMNGVEFDLRNQRAAYWFYRSHPGDMVINAGQIMNQQPVRVPADQVLHIFKPTRPGQVRGVPILAPSLVKMFLLDQYDDAELERKRIAAMFAGFVETPSPEDIIPVETGDPEATPEEGVGLSPLEPGTLQTLLPGEKISFSEPVDVGGSYEAFEYRQQLAIYSAMMTPYMLATGDTRKSSYSSMRGVVIEFRRKLERLQYQVIVHQFCRPVWRRWLADAVLNGAIDIPQFVEQQRLMTRAKWIAPRFEWVDPLKDRQAEKLAVDSGFKPRSDVIESEGYDAEEVDERIAQDHAREERLGLDFPVRQAASAQPAPDAQAIADEAAALADDQQNAA